MADELHYRQLLAEVELLVGKDEAKRLTKGKTILELVELKDRLWRQAMKPGRAA